MADILNFLPDLIPPSLAMPAREAECALIPEERERLPPVQKKYDFSIDKRIPFRYGKSKIEGRIWWKTPSQVLYLRFSGPLRGQDENISFFSIF